jgi:hypothetical protein
MLLKFRNQMSVLDQVAADLSMDRCWTEAEHGPLLTIFRPDGKIELEYHGEQATTRFISNSGNRMFNPATPDQHVLCYYIGLGVCWLHHQRTVFPADGPVQKQPAS